MIFSSPPGTGWPESAGNRIVPLAPRLSLIQRPPLAPFRSDVVIAVECLFAWYGVADWCAREGIPFVLGHALYMKAIHGGKAKDDDTLPTYLLCSLKSVCQSFHVDQHQREVCRLSPWDNVALRLNPYPADYRPAFACSRFLYPPSHQLLLRDAFPDGETTGLPRSVAVTVWVRSRLFAGGASAAPEEFGASGPDHVPFGPSDSASCAWPCDDV